MNAAPEVTSIGSGFRHDRPVNVEKAPPVGWRVSCWYCKFGTYYATKGAAEEAAQAHRDGLTLTEMLKRFPSKA